MSWTINLLFCRIWIVFEGFCWLGLYLLYWLKEIYNRILHILGWFLYFMENQETNHSALIFCKERISSYGSMWFNL